MKNLDEVLNEVKSLIAEHLNSPAVNIEADSEINSLADDSIQLFELLMAFESHYQMEVAYEDIAQMHTVADIGKYLHLNKYQK